MKSRTTFTYIYYLTRVFFIGFGFSYLFNIAGKDAWISFIIGHCISLFIIWYIIKLKKKYQKNMFLKDKGHTFLKSLYFLFSFIVAIEILFIFQTLASNFFLVKSPHFFILLPAFFLVFRICKNGWTTIGRVGKILMYISLSMVLVAFIALSNYVIKDNFLPILTIDKGHLVQATIYYIGYSTAPLIYLLLIPETNDKLMKYYFIANLTIIIMGLLIIGIVGPNLIKIYRFPEYMVLKVIKLLNFIEKVENIFAIATLIDLFMALAISMNIVKEKLPTKHRNLSFFLILLLVFSLSLYLSYHYSLALQLYYYLPLILLIFMILILISMTIALTKEKYDK